MIEIGKIVQEYQRKVEEMRVLLFIIVTSMVIYLQSLVVGFFSGKQEVVWLPPVIDQSVSVVQKSVHSFPISAVRSHDVQTPGQYDLMPKRRRVQSTIDETRALIDSELARRP